MPASNVRVELQVDPAFLSRLSDYARQKGITVDSLLIQSAQAFLEAHPVPERDGGPHGDAQ